MSQIFLGRFNRYGLYRYNPYMNKYHMGKIFSNSFDNVNAGKRGLAEGFNV